MVKNSNFRGIHLCESLEIRTNKPRFAQTERAMCYRNCSPGFLITRITKKEITRVEKIFHEKKRNFVSPSDHVIFFCVLLHKILAVQQKMLNSF